MPILEFRLADILSGLSLTMPQFIDMCILCGCDYADTIRGIGPKKALKMIQDHGSIEAALLTLDKEKYPVPEDFDFVQVLLDWPACLCRGYLSFGAIDNKYYVFCDLSVREKDWRGKPLAGL